MADADSAWLQAFEGVRRLAETQCDGSFAQAQPAETSRRLDLTQLSDTGAAYGLAQALHAGRSRLLAVVPDSASATRLMQDLRTFAPERAMLLQLPGAELSPFAGVASDRRSAMDRAAVLSALATGSAWDVLVVPASALLRRLPPPASMAASYRRIGLTDIAEREPLVAQLEAAGYLRVPLVEDPGTYALRGNLVDVYSPREDWPVRIELDDELVASLKRFDPEAQRTIEAIDAFEITPASSLRLQGAARESARQRLRSLFDAFHVPTTTAIKSIEDLLNGTLHMGLEAFMPAFHGELVPLKAYLATEDFDCWLVDAASCVRQWRRAQARLEADHEARCKAGEPTFDLAQYVLEGEALAESFEAAAQLRLTHHGGGTEVAEDCAEDALEAYARPSSAAFLVGEFSLGPLREALERERAQRGAREPLAAFRELVQRWATEDFRVEVLARTQTQCERLKQLLKGAEVAIHVGQLSEGFALASERRAFVSEGDLFGRRGRRQGERKSKSQGRSQGRRAFVEDLRELKPGDYIVHIEHGIGRYLGLESKGVGGSQKLKLEVLTLEYAGGDKLFLPVTRLAQIEKFTAREGAAPKLDKLGGQSFSKTKRKAREKVQQIADELLQLYAKRAAQKRDPLPPSDELFAEFEATFPFEETADQSRAIDEVLGDFVEERPMDRLVCGDVGFGKTEVAIRAAFRMAAAGKQVAVLCPTTVLAQQHYLSFAGRMRGFPLNIRMLSRFTPREEAAETLAGLKSGKVDIVVGTHRLISKDVHFKRLGLLVVDEEQRFGVTHKERMKRMRAEVDVLTLTATPIPRTMHLALGGLRDLSLITTPPVDRRAVRTFLCRWDEHLLSTAIEREINRGGQVFFVQNRIAKLYERANELQALLPKARIAVGHGQLKEGELERVMLDFVEGKYDVLCATTIIESGLDIPRANTMIIDRADTYGMSQLYQLRGRVGRSRERAYCYLVAPPPSVLSDEARARLGALERFTELGSGFHIASLDMELRGAGDILGTDQSGTLATVGFDLFMRMLEEAIALQRGETPPPDIDPELSFDTEVALPESYVDDTGVRLSLYKRFGMAMNDAEVDDLAQELEDRFGAPPVPALAFIESMRLKWRLRELRILGAEATAERVTLHLHPETLLDPAKLMPRLQNDPQGWKLSPDMRLTRRFAQVQANAFAACQALIDVLYTLTKDAT